MTALTDALTGTPYQQYVYSYPHKTSYRRFARPYALRELWRDEDRRSLFLYLHIPFCEQRCGFCNLFAQSRPESDRIDRYLDALTRQARVVRDALDDASFARIAIGGGTPTLLPADRLERLLGIARGMGADPGALPCSVEVSPATADADRLRVLHAAGVQRISIGVQSFIPSEATAIARHQAVPVVDGALSRIAQLRFPVFNIDLMYGLPGQDERSFCRSIEQALQYRPQELYLYPLYVRPRTALERRPPGEDRRLALYRAGRAALIARGWRQESLRLFRAPEVAADTGPRYRCQDDGMVGLGCGARSYTSRVHYAGEWAVDQRQVRDLIGAYLETDENAFAHAWHGYELDPDDQRRRWVLLSLLEHGLDVPAYVARWGGLPGDHLPELAELTELGLVTSRGGTLLLTEAGIERADAVGAALFSTRARALMDAYVP